MKKKFEVHKYGGAIFMISRESFLSQIKYVFNSAQKDNSKVIFVASAFANVTRILDLLFGFWQRDDKAAKDCLFEYLKEIHIQILTKFHLENFLQLEDYFKRLKLLLNKEIRCENQTKDQAQIQVYGEILSTFIFFEFLKKNFPEKRFFLGDSRNFIKTDLSFNDSYIKAKPNLDICFEKTRTHFHINKNGGEVCLFQGFIGSNYNGDDVTMGYDSSDLTASIYARALSEIGTTNLVFWKDVKGVLRDLKNKDDYFSKMSYQEFIDFSQNNSTPIIPSSIGVVEGKHVKVQIRSFLDLENEGTKIY